MVNGTATSPDRRNRARDGAPAPAAGVLGRAKLNPFGDLPTLQHLSARLARLIRQAMEPLLRRELRCWAEPLSVQRFADYRGERPDGLTAWLPLPIEPGASEGGGAAVAVFDGRFVLELLDLFFGGTGSVPDPMPAEFPASAEALVARLGGALVGPLHAAWEPLSRMNFAVGRVEANGAMLPGLDGEDAVIVTRFGLAGGGGDAAGGTPDFIDILYPVAALKPHAPALTGKVLDKAEPDPAWRNALTRAAMNVRFPVRSVLAEPTVPLSRLMNLVVGDVIPLSIGPTVPVMVGGDRLGTGTVGTSNGRAAVQLVSLSSPKDLDQ